MGSGARNPLGKDGSLMGKLALAGFAVQGIVLEPLRHQGPHKGLQLDTELLLTPGTAVQTLLDRE